MDIMDSVKLMLGITDNTKDAQVQVAIDMVVSHIRATINYRANEPLPAQLEGIAITQAIQLYATLSQLATVNSAQNKTITSISDNGQSISYSAQTIKDIIGNQDVNSILTAHDATLKQFRRINR